MKLLNLSLLGLAALAMANPIAEADAGAESSLHQHDKRCSNHGSQMACEQACRPVVQRGCKYCNGNASCVIACERAKYNACYACCDRKCSTC